MSKKKRRMQAAQQQQLAKLDGMTVLKKLNQIPGVFRCEFTHKTSETTADFQWTGDTLNTIWPQVLAFFRWTQNTYHSESQLRLFVHRTTGEWKAWAFPQKARLGMAAKELDKDDEGYHLAQEQRAQFNDDWEYWGTVHHHCSASAFQSGTDEANERNQEGIHITVGHLDRLTYDIHFRMYIGGFKLKDVTALEFWDIGDELLSVPERFRPMLPPNIDETICKWQMGTPPPLDTEFPEVWKTNIIDITPKAVVSQPTNFHRSQFAGHGCQYIGRIYLTRAIPGTEYDFNRAAQRIENYIKSKESQLCTTWQDALELLTEIDHVLGADAMNLFAICSDCDVMPEALAKHIFNVLTAKEKEEEEKEKERLLTDGAPAPKQPQQQQKTQGLISKGPHITKHWSDTDFSGY